MSVPVRTMTVAEPEGGWFVPWPNVIELSQSLPADHWVLVGGLMVQAHAMAHGINAVRPTEDLDVLLHVEISSSVITETDRTLCQLGYVLQEPADERRKSSPHYRYIKGERSDSERIDVMIPDHAGPAVARRLKGRPMLEVEGGTQALGRTMTCLLERSDDASARITVPDELGALILKGAAYTVDTRHRDRHLHDAAVLAACITDHARELARLAGSDRKRLGALARALADTTHPAWLALTPGLRLAGQDTLRILAG